MSTVPVEYPEINSPMDAVPNLHEVLADLRERHAVAPIRYRGDIAPVDHALRRREPGATSHDESFPSAAAYARHTEPVMGRTIQCMAGDEHRRNRGLVRRPFARASRPLASRRS